MGSCELSLLSVGTSIRTNFIKIYQALLPLLCSVIFNKEISGKIVLLSDPFRPVELPSLGLRGNKKAALAAVTAADFKWAAFPWFLW